MNKLLIVESPSKCSTISRYLGPDFKVVASYGHIRNLRKSINAINCDKDFALDFVVNKEKQKQLKNLEKHIKRSSHVYIATDFDREGEAIGWSVTELCQKQLKNKPVQRITFTEITPSAIKKALENPRSLDRNLIDAYRARTVVDFLVGFHLSSVTWSAITKTASVGRVQSPAVKLIVERDAAINAFKSKLYWTLEPHYNNHVFELHTYNGVRVKKYTFDSEEKAQDACRELEAKAVEIEHYKSKSVIQTLKSPDPYTTAKLQQDASTKLNFQVKTTMSVAQKLYEGIILKGVKTPLITYMRTDSTNISEHSVQQIKSYCQKNNLNFLKRPAKKKKKSDVSQEAHEAIRPIDVNIHPDRLKNEKKEYYLLYKLIWLKTIVSYMPPAKYKINTYYFKNKDESNIFTTQEREILDKGWKVMDSTVEETDVDDNIDIHTKIKLTSIKHKKHHTKPPAKFSEASLVKALESMNIGRPSTYEYILDTIKKRSYAKYENKTLTSTDVGNQLVSFLDKEFSSYIDYQFTSNLESNLDEIACGKINYIDVLKKFWEQLHRDIVQYFLNQKRKCSTCNQLLQPKISSRGWYLACSNKCSYNSPKSVSTQEVIICKDRLCVKCGGQLCIKVNKTTKEKFAACQKYPKCKYSEPFDVSNLQKCDKCQKGWLIKRKARKTEKEFFGCTGYPFCKNIVDIVDDPKQDLEDQ